MILPSELAAELQHRSARIEAAPAEDGTFTGRLVPYEQRGLLMPGVFEVFTRGALSSAVKDPARVKVMGIDHSSTVLGRALALEDRPDGLWGTFRIANTPAGQEALTLLREGVLDELSIDFMQQPKHRTLTDLPNGELLVRQDRGHLLGVSPVSHGAYGRKATVSSVRSEQLDEARRRAMELLASLRA